MTGSYACAHVTPITVWVMSKNENDVYINLEMCQITVVCLVRHFTCHRFNSAISETFQFTKNDSCTPCMPMFHLLLSLTPDDFTHQKGDPLGVKKLTIQRPFVSDPATKNDILS